MVVSLSRFLPSGIAIVSRLSRQFAVRTTSRLHKTCKPPDAAEMPIYFIDKKGRESKVNAWDGQNLLELAHENEIEVEGACEGSLACCTCHVILEGQKAYETFPDPTEREEDLLDMAPGLTETSRLGCQLNLNAKKHFGMKFRLPSTTRNFYVDGFVPKPH